jgi:hypothetical protein
MLLVAWFLTVPLLSRHSVILRVRPLSHLRHHARDLTAFLYQRMRDYCIGMISSRWRAKDANVCGAAGLQHRPEIGAYCSRRYRKKRQALVPRALRTAQFNYGTFRKRPRNHIGALAGGITAYSLLYYRGPSNRNPKGRNKKAGPGHRLGLVQKPSICGSAFFDFKKTFAIFAREHGAEAVICFNRWAPSERFELGRIDDQITGHSLP